VSGGIGFDIGACASCDLPLKLKALLEQICFCCGFRFGEMRGRRLICSQRHQDKGKDEMNCMKNPKTTDQVSSRKAEKAFMQTKMPTNRPGSGGNRAYKSKNDESSLKNHGTNR
jgi:hypothetical protein